MLELVISASGQSRAAASFNNLNSEAVSRTLIWMVRFSSDSFMPLNLGWAPSQRGGILASNSSNSIDGGNER